MSMLAGPKRKQKWCLNPRGQLWSSDSNKFGQKMLEKMGWKEGKGLGANENGRTEHIKISYKNDSKGMGYKETEEWLDHDDNFSTLLEELSAKNEIKTSKTMEVKSLEEQSQKSRVRVHYHKFTRGKDLSRYSKKDLANIFGKKELIEESNSVQETSLSVNYAEDSYFDENASVVNADSEALIEESSGGCEVKRKKKRKMKELEDETVELLEESCSSTTFVTLKKRKKKNKNV